ncbi:MAG: phenylacetate-CoA oxygenase subunit PaaC [Chitinophagaceae bacterium]|nr:phenylacetate-CoA oxygenase subunit PaaC [Chitinophagaceae bacterium]
MNDYLLHLADTSLILSHRNSEWCGHGPVLEQDIAITNIALDLLGQARYFYQYAARLTGNTDEDKLAFLRHEREFKNLLITELPKGDWAHTVLRQYLFSQFQFFQFEKLQHHSDKELAAIAAKSLKETAYHLRWSREWVIRLGDGTEESHRRMLAALDTLWPYTHEMFRPADYELACEVNVAELEQPWKEAMAYVFQEANLPIPQHTWFQYGGKTGYHTEYLGYILAEMQYMQRAYPGATW